MIDKFGHVKWFNSAEPMPEPGFNLIELLIVAIVIAVGLFALKYIDKWLKDHKIISKLDKMFKPYRSWAPLIVRLSTSAFLLINFMDNFLLAPNVASTNSTLPYIISGLFVVAAVLLALGLFTRIGVLALLTGYLLVFKQAGIVDVLDHVEYIGIALYLWLRGPGKYSVDSYLTKGNLTLSNLRRYSLDCYRIAAGVALATLALSEKILNVTVAQDFLNHYNWNILSGIGVSDRYFILLAGSIELLVGIALILNYAPRLLVSVVLGLMITTAILLGVSEIYGHLFAVGIVAVFLVNDHNPGKTS